MLLLLLGQLSGVCWFLELRPDDIGDVRDVAAVEAVLAGDQVVSCTDGAKDEVGLGEMLASSGACSRPLSTLVLMKGTVSLLCGAARCTIVCVPGLPFSFELMCSIRSESLWDMLLLLLSFRDGVKSLSSSSSGCPSNWSSAATSNRTERLRCGMRGWS